MLGGITTAIDVFSRIETRCHVAVRLSLQNCLFPVCRCVSRGALSVQDFALFFLFASVLQVSLVARSVLQVSWVARSVLQLSGLVILAAAIQWRVRPASPISIPTAAANDHWRISGESAIQWVSVSTAAADHVHTAAAIQSVPAFSTRTATCLPGR